MVVSEGTNDRDFTVGTSSNNTTIIGSTVNVKTLERCFNERIDREMSNIIDTVEDWIQNAILTAIDNIVAPKIELAIRSINASSGRDVTSVTANSERGEHVGINTFFENASGNNNTLHVSNVNDETRHNIPDEESELLVPETHFDRQAHTHHSYRLQFLVDLDLLRLHAKFWPPPNQKCFLTWFNLWFLNWKKTIFSWCLNGDDTNVYFHLNQHLLIRTKNSLSLNLQQTSRFCRLIVEIKNTGAPSS